MLATAAVVVLRLAERSIGSRSFTFFCNLPASNQLSWLELAVSVGGGGDSGGRSNKSDRAIVTST